MRTMRCLAVCAVSLLALAGTLVAADGQLMHCFTFTVVESATDADWQAFFKASDALPGKIPAVKGVWYGKLRSPQTFYATDAETRKKITKDSPKATGEVTRVQRQYGVCMAIAGGADGLKAYDANPAHEEWVAAYSKVRVAGTTTFDIIPVK